MIRGILLIALVVAGIGCESIFIDYFAKPETKNAVTDTAKPAGVKTVAAETKKDEKPAVEYSEATGKDDRTYVFVSAKARAHFDKHGEFPTDKFVTRIAYGAKGETVRFESDAAIAEYDRKHMGN